MKMFRVCLTGFLFFACLGIGTAQPGDPPPPHGQPVPISGIELLIGAGALLGAGKLMTRKRN